MPISGAVVYREAFARRTSASLIAEQTVLDRPGICGTFGSAGRPGGRILITDDRAAPVLVSLPHFHPQFVTVFESARRCLDLVVQAGRWHGEPATSMICRDLRSIPSLPPPDGLQIRAVRRIAADPASGVPLEQAALALLRADPQAAHVPLPGFKAFLQSLPSATHLLAGVDAQGAVRATAGSSVLGADANSYFVSTDPQWRGRGVATAMTATALHWAHSVGAQMASLDASRAGLSIYLRLGFEEVSPITLFARFD
jgi:GNAT superfamily N-acetyltransferase